jgi:hypothetical protein
MTTVSSISNMRLGKKFGFLPLDYLVLVQIVVVQDTQVSNIRAIYHALILMSHTFKLINHPAVLPFILSTGTHKLVRAT